MFQMDWLLAGSHVGKASLNSWAMGDKALPAYNEDCK